MGSQNHLFEMADRQQGYFTAKQAEECGYKRSNFHRGNVADNFIAQAVHLKRLNNADGFKLSG